MTQSGVLGQGSSQFNAFRIVQDFSNCSPLDIGGSAHPCLRFFNITKQNVLQLVGLTIDGNQMGGGIALLDKSIGFFDYVRFTYNCHPTGSGYGGALFVGSGAKAAIRWVDGRKGPGKGAYFVFHPCV